MSQRPNNLDTTLLAIELLRRIPRHRKITASELRQSLLESGFDRDLRTIQRHLEVLTAHFEDLECDTRSKPYGYCWKSHSHGLSLPLLNEQESLLLLASQRALGAAAA